jgi:riboflavin biosynthesis pyrimidine reductase
VTKPKVVVVQAASVDGRLTLSPDTLLMAAMDRWVAVAGASEVFLNTLKQTYQPQAQLEGSGSFMLESMTPDPLPPADGDLAALYDDFLPAEIVNQPGRRWFTVVDSRGRIRWMYKEMPGEDGTVWYALLLVSRQTPPAYLAYLRRETIPYLVVGEDRVDLACALDKLNTLLGVTTVMSTAGGTLNGALLRAGLIDEVNIDFFPGLIGGRATSSLFDSTELGPDDIPTRLNLISAEAQPDGHVWLRYEVAPR